MENDSEDYAKKSAEFKRWLALYFIDKGNWKLTDKAVEEFGTDATPRQTMEFAEDYSAREREERTQYRVGLTPKEKKEIAYKKIENMIREGKSEEIYDNGYITNSRLKWANKNVRAYVIKKLIEVLQKNPVDLTFKDFIKNGLSGLMNCYESSPYKAIREVFPKLKLKPWEMAKTSTGFFNSKKNRIAAVKWLVEKLNKNPRDLTAEDFRDNKLSGLLAYYKGSSYEAVKEAFPNKNIKPWEMTITPQGFYHKKENRTAAVRWLIKKLEKDPRDLTSEDFRGNILYGLLDYYKGSPHKAVKEVFPSLDIQPWEMKKTSMGIFLNKENRVVAVKWLVEKLEKEPKDITQEDFIKNRLWAILNYKNGSPYEALIEAGLVTEADESYMRQKGNRGYRDAPSSKEVLEAAKKFARNAEKKPTPKAKTRRTT